MSGKFECYNCKFLFDGENYSWYFYYEKGEYHVCPNCQAKVVPDYDFEYMGLVDKILSISFMIGIGLLVIVNLLELESYWWHVMYVIPIFVSGICTLIYNNLASELSQNTYGTRSYKDRQ